MHYEHSFATLSDDELLRRLTELLSVSRRAEADLVAHIGEVDARRLYAREASPSMFAYCIEVLHLSEAEAYLRITAARAGRQHPLILDMLATVYCTCRGSPSWRRTSLRTRRDRLLGARAGRTKRQIEELLSEIAPRRDAPGVMRKLPTRAAEFVRSSSRKAAGNPVRHSLRAPADRLAPVPLPRPAAGARSSTRSGRSCFKCYFRSGPGDPAARALPVQGPVHG